MKTLGIIGGLGPESTIEYYRHLIATHRRRTGDGSYPHLIINSIDLDKVRRLVSAGQHDGLADYLVAELERLAAAGVDLALIAANTPHIVFDAVRDRSPLPLVSIVEATCRAVRARGLSRPALFGTRFTMEGRFYPDVFQAAGIELAVPTPDEREIIHTIYLDELVYGIFRPESHARLLEIVDRMHAQDGIDGVILGGTELPPPARGSARRRPAPRHDPDPHRGSGRAALLLTICARG